MLKHFPNKYIHEPWTAPEQVQVAARCVVGRDYPLPMVNHQQASRINLQRIRLVYQQLTQCAKTPGLFPNSILGSTTNAENSKSGNKFIGDLKLRAKNNMVRRWLCFLAPVLSCNGAFHYLLPKMSTSTASL